MLYASLSDIDNDTIYDVNINTIINKTLIETSEAYGEKDLKKNSSRYRNFLNLREELISLVSTRITTKALYCLQL